MTSKQRKERKEKLKLRARVLDIAVGACAEKVDNDTLFGGCELSRLVPALKVQFGTENNGYLWELYNLDEFSDIESVVKFLYESGVKA